MIVPPEVFGGRPVSSQGSEGSGGLNEEVRRLCAAGRKIEAIKVFRERTGAGLAESKSAVEAIERGGPVDLGEVIQRAASGGPLIDPRTAKKAGVAVGAITIAVFSAVFLAIAGVTAALFLVASPSDDIDGPVSETPSGTRPVRPGGNEAGMAELLRFGGEGTGAGRFKDNRVVAVDAAGRIYSSDYSPGRIQVFGPDGKFISAWPVGENENVYDLGVSRSGRVYLATSKGITAFDGDEGTIAAQVAERRLRGIAIGLDGRVYSAGRDGFDIYDKDLKLLRSFKNAAKDSNSSFGFEKVDVDGNGFVFLVERTTDELVKFSSDGKFLNRIPTGLRSANDIALDPAGRIFLSDTSSIAVFTPEGRPLKTLKANQAFGITFDDAGMMYIASRPFVLKVDPGLE